MKKGKNDQHYEPFVPMGKRMILESEEWQNLSPGARTIYEVLKATYYRKKDGNTNNGELQAKYSDLQKFKGLKNPHTISDCFKELEKKGWIKKTWSGGLFRIPNKYKLMGKHDDHL